MTETEELKANWLDGLEDELVKELLDDESPLFVLPKMIEPEPSLSPEPIRNQFIHTIYSGPTLEDIESALSVTYHTNESNDRNVHRPTISMPEKGLSKMDNKYTLKIKSCGDGMADDGYKWRKYGQKSIKNSPNPRSYYRCTNPRCSAKKQVERSVDEPDTLLVTYEGLHLHFAYSHFLLTQQPLHPAKRPKLMPQIQQALAQTSPQVSPPTLTQQSAVEGAAGADRPRESPQGLLEDVVPLLIRNPSKSPTLSTSYPSSPPSSSSSSLSWSPSSTYFDVGILSSSIR